MTDIATRTLQELLRKAGHCVELDGVYGPATEGAAGRMRLSLGVVNDVVAASPDRRQVTVDDDFWVALKRATAGRYDSCAMRTSATGDAMSPVELDTGSPQRLIWPWVAAGAGVLVLGGIFLATRKRRRRRR